MFGVTGVALASIAAISMMVMIVLDKDQQRRSAAGWVGHTQQVIVAIASLLASADDAEMGQRGFLITNDATFLEPYESSVASVWRNLGEVVRLTADNPAHQQRLEVWRGLLQARLAIIDHTIALARSGDIADATDIVRRGDGKMLMDGIRKVAAEVVTGEQDLLRQRHVNVEKLERRTTDILVGLLIIVTSGILLGSAVVIRLLLGNAAKVQATMAAAEREMAAGVLRDSEARLRLMQRIGGIAYYDRMLTETTGMITDEFVQLYGLPSEQTHISSLDAIAFIHPEDREGVAAARDRLLDGDTSVTVEARIIRTDGAVRWLSMHTEVIPGPDGLPYRIVSAQRDITDIVAARDMLAVQHDELERRVIERTKALVTAETRQRASFENSPVPLFMLGENDIVIAVSNSWLRLLGYKRSEVIGHFLDDFRAPGSEPLEASRRSELLAPGEFEDLKRRYIRRDGAVIEVLLSGRVYQQDGSTVISCVMVDVTALMRAEAALGKSEEHTRLALSAVNSIGTYDWDIVNDRVYCNDSFARIFGVDPDRAAAGAPLSDYLANVPADARVAMLLEYEHAKRNGGDCSVIHPVNQPDGSVRWCLAKSHCILAPDGTPLRMPGVLIDITDQRIVEDQLRQSQKMEAVGQLTGGLAHDFNNMLQGITGSLELLKVRLAAGQLGGADRYITAAQGDAARAATLTQRLLAFSRRQVLDPEPTNADALIAGMTDLIQRAVGPEIQIAVVPTTDLWTTLCDSNQMENALLNLCINARDAMQNGGRLTIETANVSLDRRGAFDWDVTPGEYVAVCVTDTGTGMPMDVVARAFDPFFTTKPLGVGTGLGLSMIYGFAQQSGGQARIYSEVGVGTTVRIYLPRHRGEVDKKQTPDGVEEAPLAEEGQVVLIVDDEPTVRMLVTEVLQEQGFTMIEAEDGASGLRVLQSNARIDLLISDVGLPGGMNGRQMADAARIGRPDLKVLFITGYAPSAMVGSGRLEHGMQVMTKPFALDALAARIKALISEVEIV